MALLPSSLSLFPSPEMLVLASSLLACLTVLMTTPASESSVSSERDAVFPTSFGKAIGSPYLWASSAVAILPQSLVASEGAIDLVSDFLSGVPLYHSPSGNVGSLYEL